MGLPPGYGFEHLKGSPRGAGLFLSSVIARCILYRRLGERRWGEISHGLYCANSQNRALSLLLPSSPSIQAGLLAKALGQSTYLATDTPYSRASPLPHKPGFHNYFCGVFRIGYNPNSDSMINVANNTKWVIPSMALVSPSLRLIALTISVINTITVCTGVIAI